MTPSVNLAARVGLLDRRQRSVAVSKPKCIAGIVHIKILAIGRVLHPWVVKSNAHELRLILGYIIVQNRHDLLILAELLIALVERAGKRVYGTGLLVTRARKIPPLPQFMHLIYG